MFSDPLGLWCPDCHYDQTLQVALECGMSGRAAEALAKATKMVDRENLVETVKPHSPRHGMPDSDWRGYAASQLDAAITAKGTGAALRALGRGLHTVQDAWAHDLRIPQGTISEHFYSPDPNWRDPDDPAQNLWEWQMSRKATADYISSFMRARGKDPKCGTEQ